MPCNFGSALWWMAMIVRNACSIFQADFWDIPNYWAMNTEEAPLLEKIKEYMACSQIRKINLVP